MMNCLNLLRKTAKDKRMHFARIILEVSSVHASLVTMATLNNARIWMNALQSSTNVVHMHTALIQSVLTTVNASQVILVMVETVKI